MGLHLNVNFCLESLNKEGKKLLTPSKGAYRHCVYIIKGALYAKREVKSINCLSCTSPLLYISALVHIRTLKIHGLCLSNFFCQNWKA